MAEILWRKCKPYPSRALNGLWKKCSGDGHTWVYKGRTYVGIAMIGIVLVTHGRLAEELVSTLEHIVGPQEKVATVCIQPDDDMESRRRDILAAINRVNEPDGAILLADLFGGTPSNLAISVMNETGVEVITGVNLPMIIQLAQVRKSRPLMEAVTEAQEAGRKNIHVASQLLADRSPKPC